MKGLSTEIKAIRTGSYPQTGLSKDTLQKKEQTPLPVSLQVIFGFSISQLY
jgi:hypothetical protein